MGKPDWFCIIKRRRNEEKMTVKDFQAIVVSSLEEREEITHIMESEHSVLVSCNNQFSFFVNIMESKGAFIHSESNRREIDEYFMSHTDEEFAKDVMNAMKKHPGFYFYFMVFKKLEEMGFIDSGLFSHVMDSIVFYEEEFDKFMAKFLNHYWLGER